MASYLVTGGAGFVGSHLVEDLIDRGHRVRVLDDLSSGSRSNVPRAAEFIEGNVADVSTVARALAGLDGCFHLAAISSVERCHREWVSNHQVNLTGTINVFDNARRASRSSPIPVVYASTAAIYGDRSKYRVGEDCPPTPLSAYGADKAACEFQARIAGQVHGVPTVGLRFFNLYGPRQDPQNPYSGVVSIFADRLRHGRSVEIFGDGEQVRDFTFVADAVTALRRAMAMADTAAPVYNVCTGVGTSVRELAEIVAGLCGEQLIVRQRPARKGDVRISVGDPTRASEHLDFEARTRLPDGLAVTLESLGLATGHSDAVAAE